MIFAQRKRKQKNKNYSGVHPRVSTLIQPSFHKNKKRNTQPQRGEDRFFFGFDFTSFATIFFFKDGMHRFLECYLYAFSLIGKYTNYFFLQLYFFALLFVCSVFCVPEAFALSTSLCFAKGLATRKKKKENVYITIPSPSRPNRCLFFGSGLQ